MSNLFYQVTDSTDFDGQITIWHEGDEREVAHHHFYGEDYNNGITGAISAAKEWIDSHKNQDCAELGES